MRIQKLLTPIITTFSVFLLFLLEVTLCSVNKKFEACASRSCGDGKDLSFPFYIAEQQPSYCGYPGFNVSCRNNQSVLGILSKNFLIHELFHANHSFRVSDMGFLDVRNTCSIPALNLSLAGIRFNVSPDYEEKLYLYNCSSKSVRNKLKSYAVNCERNSSSSGSIFAMFSSDPNTNLAGKRCHGVGTPIEDDEKSTRTNSWEQYNEAVRKGFLLEWNAPNCTGCRNSGGRCGYDEQNFQFWCYCPDRPHRVACHSGRRGMSVSLKLGLGIGIGFGCVILVFCIIVWVLHKRRFASLKLLSRNISSNSDMEMDSIYFGVPVFSYAELKAATNNFDPDKELGDGGFGTVYYGILKDGREVAVKRLYEHNYKRMEQFINEVELLTRVRHKNLVSLYGCTSRHSRELLLLYEYIPNGTVADHLFGERAQSSPLSWPIRMNIAIETASALAYLHASDIIHRDVKTNNILLDNNFCVKVVDFGLSRVRPADVTHISTAPQGTPGYLDPEYHESYQLTEKSDVYSFGVVLIELISSLPAVDISRSRNEVNLASLAVKRIQNCMLDELIDPNLGYESDLIVKRMTRLVAELAFRCLQQDKEMRPSMDDVLEVLKEIENGIYGTEKGDLNTDCQEVKCMQVSQTLDPDDAVLLKDSESPHSPISVTEKWTSSSSTTTPNTSA